MVRDAKQKKQKKEAAKIVEQVIDLRLINDKLNYLIGLVEGLRGESNESEDDDDDE